MTERKVKITETRYDDRQMTVFDALQESMDEEFVPNCPVCEGRDPECPNCNGTGFVEIPY